VTSLAEDADLPDTSDVDVTVVTDARRPVAKLGKLQHAGVLLGVTAMPRDVPSEVDVVARTYFFASSFRGGQVIADPTGCCVPLEAHISPRFGRPEAVGERIEDVLTRVTRRLSSLDPQAPRHERAIARLLSASMPPRAPLVA
jgi:hypothetical protein